MRRTLPDAIGHARARHHERSLATFTAILVSAAWTLFAQSAVTPRVLPFVEVAPGVEFASSEDRGLVAGAGPIALYVLRVDPARTRIAVRLALDRSPALERVLDIASRAGAVAAVNAGFFLPSGAPAGVLAAHGALVAIGSSPRAAIGIADTPAGERLLVGRIRAFWLPWTLWGGAWPAAVVRAADAGDLQRWDLARDVVGGAGLLVSAGAPVTDWTSERLRAGFTTQRHPRTMAGVDRDGFLWLFAADGRQPDRSIGMTFDDLVRLALAHGLRDALNLDGGGSTTMVVQGRVVNRPSDLTGPRAVSDALVVLPR